MAKSDVDVLWASPMRGRSRPDRALSLARRLPQAHVHMVARPLPGDEALYRAIRRMAVDVFSLSFHGAPARGEARALLARARLLLGTTDDEGLPRAYLQAWELGVPVAALADPGGMIAREGLGVAADSPARLLEAMGALLEDERARLAASARCARFMARHRGETRAPRAYLDAFEAACRPPTPAAPRRGLPLHG